MTRATPSPLGRPEHLFGVQAAVLDNDGRCRQAMRTGEWMLSEDGSLCAGSLAVLADSVLGNAVVAARPDGYWPVTTELSLDIGGQPPCDGSPLHGESWQVQMEDGGGLAQGQILDDSYRPVATGTTRLRYTPVPLGFPGDCASAAEPLSFADPTARALSTVSVLGASIHLIDGMRALVVPGDPALANPMGNMHGGILLCASEIAGCSSLHSEVHPLATSSLRIIYVRPAPTTAAITFTAEVQHRSRTLGVAQVTSRDESGKTCTVATITCHNQARGSR